MKTVCTWGSAEEREKSWGELDGPLKGELGEW